MAEEKATPKPATKRTLREILKGYRQLGLPNAKRFRRRTRLEQAVHERETNIGVVQELVRRIGVYMRLCEEMKKETNWAVRGDDVIWIGECDPLELISNAEKSTR